jgi:hypothetical protein
MFSLMVASFLCCCLFVIESSYLALADIHNGQGHWRYLGTRMELFEKQIADPLGAGRFHVSDQRTPTRRLPDIPRQANRSNTFIG